MLDEKVMPVLSAPRKQQRFSTKQKVLACAGVFLFALVTIVAVDVATSKARIDGAELDLHSTQADVDAHDAKLTFRSSTDSIVNSYDVSDIACDFYYSERPLTWSKVSELRQSPGKSHQTTLAFQNTNFELLKQMFRSFLKMEVLAEPGEQHLRVSCSATATVTALGVIPISFPVSEHMEKFLSDFISTSSSLDVEALGLDNPTAVFKELLSKAFEFDLHFTLSDYMFEFPLEVNELKLVIPELEYRLHPTDDLTNALVVSTEEFSLDLAKKGAEATTTVRINSQCNETECMLFNMDHLREYWRQVKDKRSSVSMDYSSAESSFLSMLLGEKHWLEGEVLTDQLLSKLAPGVFYEGQNRRRSLVLNNIDLETISSTHDVTSPRDSIVPPLVDCLYIDADALSTALVCGEIRGGFAVGYVNLVDDQGSVLMDFKSETTWTTADDLEFALSSDTSLFIKEAFKMDMNIELSDRFENASMTLDAWSYNTDEYGVVTEQKALHANVYSDFSVSDLEGQVSVRGHFDFPAENNGETWGSGSLTKVGSELSYKNDNYDFQVKVHSKCTGTTAQCTWIDYGPDGMSPPEVRAMEDDNVQMDYSGTYDVTDWLDWKITVDSGSVKSGTDNQEEFSFTSSVTVNDQINAIPGSFHIDFSGGGPNEPNPLNIMSKFSWHNDTEALFLEELFEVSEGATTHIGVDTRYDLTYGDMDPVNPIKGSEAMHYIMTGDKGELLRLEVSLGLLHVDGAGTEVSTHGEQELKTKFISTIYGDSEWSWCDSTRYCADGLYCQRPDYQMTYDQTCQPCPTDPASECLDSSWNCCSEEFVKRCGDVYMCGILPDVGPMYDGFLDMTIKNTYGEGAYTMSVLMLESPTKSFFDAGMQGAYDTDDNPDHMFINMSPTSYMKIGEEIMNMRCEIEMFSLTPTQDGKLTHSMTLTNQTDGSEIMHQELHMDMTGDYSTMWTATMPQGSTFLRASGTFLAIDTTLSVTAPLVGSPLPVLLDGDAMIEVDVGAENTTVVLSVDWRNETADGDFAIDFVVSEPLGVNQTAWDLNCPYDVYFHLNTDGSWMAATSAFTGKLTADNCTESQAYVDAVGTYKDQPHNFALLMDKIRVGNNKDALEGTLLVHLELTDDPTADYFLGLIPSSAEIVYKMQIWDLDMMNPNALKETFRINEDIKYILDEEQWFYNIEMDIWNLHWYYLYPNEDYSQPPQELEVTVLEQFVEVFGFKPLTFMHSKDETYMIENLYLKRDGAECNALNSNNNCPAENVMGIDFEAWHDTIGVDDSDRLLTGMTLKVYSAGELVIDGKSFWGLSNSPYNPPQATAPSVTHELTVGVNKDIHLGQIFKEQTGVTLTYSLDPPLSPASGMVFDATTGRLVGVPNQYDADQGEYVMSLCAADAYVTSADCPTVTLSIAGGNGSSGEDGDIVSVNSAIFNSATPVCLLSIAMAL
jgi:hypothetical protein